MKGTLGFGLAQARAAIVGIAASFLLGGCLSGGGGADSHWVGDIETDITISGSVGDGPTVNSDVRIVAIDGTEIASFKSDASGSYSIDVVVKANQFPLLIDASGGTDIVTNAAPDFTMYGAVLSASNNTVANVNPFTTFTVEVARDMNGGLTRDNLAAAERIVVESMNSGLSTLAASGPLQTRIDAGNVAEIVKSSETLAEIVRRTRDAMLAAGRGTNADAVIQALASDLIDGVIEGNGGPRADRRLAAVANIASAQVLLEAMVNELHVNGADASDAMREAISQVATGSPQPTLDELASTEQMVQQAMVGLSAAYAITGDSNVYAIIEGMAGVQGGMAPSLVRTLLPGNYRNVMNMPVKAAANGNQSVLSTANQVVRDGTVSADNANRAPTISGQPPASIRAGNQYDFTPTASDLDNDTLTFRIGGKPEWANFNETSGRLWGTPHSSDVGNFGGITIIVSDGELSSQLGPFSINVTSGNSGPTISGTAPDTVRIGDTYSFTPNASDPEGDELRFEITGKPDWASFSTSTGRLSGTPGRADVGLFQGIQITVTDGTYRASLAPFSIEVIADGSATGSVTLDWTPPSENEDGSASVDVIGYRIYWAPEGESWGPPAMIDNPSVTRFIVDDLPPGRYEFVATAVNSSGLESRFSNTIIRTVQ